MHFVGLVSSFAVAMTTIALWGHLPDNVTDRSGSRSRRVLLGLMLGAGAFGSMLTPYVVVTGVYLDMRMPLIATAGIVGGPISAAFSVIFPLAYRLFVGGAGAPAGYTSILTSMAIGAISHVWLGSRAPKARHLAVIATCVALSGMLSFFLVPRDLRSANSLSIVPLVVLTFGATWLFALSLLRDERHRALIKRNDTYRSIIETLPDSLNAKDRQGRFIAANPATARLMQAAAADDLLGKSDFDFYTAEMARTFHAQEERVLANTIVGPIEERVSLPDGTERWLETMKTPMFDREGRVDGIITHNRDITDRKRLEAELNRSQAFFEAAVTQMADGLVFYDADGLIRICNQQYRDLFPKTADLRVPGASFSDIIRAAVARGEEKPQADLEVWVAERKVALTTSGDRSIRLEDGRAIEARSRPIADGGVLVTFSDVTDVRQKESEAREANRLLLMAEEIAQVGHWRYDVVSNLVTWSDEVFRIHGIEPQPCALPVETAIGFYHPDDLPEVQRSVSEAIEFQRNFDFTLRIIRPTGQCRYVLSRGVCEIDPVSRQVTGVFGVLADISDLTQVQRRLSEKSADLEVSEALYRMLADTTSDIITQLNLNLSRRYVSPACRALLGYEPKEMLQLPPAELIHPDDFGNVRRLMEQVIAGQFPEDKVTTDYRIRHRSGHWVWVEAAINLVREPAGRPESLLLSLRDVTERREAAQQLEQAKVTAENAARLKSEFVANMSHELRTPLTGILGIHDLLDCDLGLSSEQKRQVRMARDAGRSLLRIVNDILDFSKIEADHMTIETVPFKVSDLIEACRSLGQESARNKPLSVSATMLGVPERLLGDPARLRQVILNLTTNAVKFTEEGRVTLLVTYDHDAGRLRVEVIDTGIGIAEDKLALLFGRFSQTDASITRRYGGTGLGLAISKRLINLMGGDIGVSSEIGRGSTFWLEMPLSTPTDMTEADSDAGGATSSATFFVLLAEDNEVNQDIIKSMLEHRGHRVLAVEDGLKAIEAISDHPSIDVVLMDVQMPVMDGLTATRSIRAAEQGERRQAVPIVGLTANAMIEDVQRCLDAGMQAHVAKPIEWADLFATMDQVVLRATAAGEPASPAAPLIEAKLDHLDRVIGQERVDALLSTFAIALEQMLADFGRLEGNALSARCHDLTAMAGQLGFLELSALGTAMGQDARRGQAATGVCTFEDCLRRAAAAALAFSHGRSLPPAGQNLARAS